MSENMTDGDARNKVISWINQAITAKPAKKLYLLLQAQELVVNCTSVNLLNDFYEDIMGFQQDANADIRHFCVGFIEKACKKDKELLVRAISCYKILLNDRATRVQTKCLHSFYAIYEMLINWTRSKVIAKSQFQTVWNGFTEIINQIYLITAKHDGRFNGIAFHVLKNIILLHKRGEYEEDIKHIIDFFIDFKFPQRCSSDYLTTYIRHLIPIGQHCPQYSTHILERCFKLQELILDTLPESESKKMFDIMQREISKLSQCNSVTSFLNKTECGFPPSKKIRLNYETFSTNTPENSHLKHKKRNKNQNYSITGKEMNKLEKFETMKKAFSRIMTAENDLNCKSQILIAIASNFPQNAFREELLGFIHKDIVQRIDLAISWLYEEHNLIMGYKNKNLFDYVRNTKYDVLLNSFVNYILSDDSLDCSNQESVLLRLLLESPRVPDSVLSTLNELSVDEKKYAMGFKLIQELIVRRPPLRNRLLNYILTNTSHDNVHIRETALDVSSYLYKSEFIQPTISQYIVNKCTSPSTLKTADLYLFFKILPDYGSGMGILGRVYASTTIHLKRDILKLIGPAILKMGMDSKDILNFISEFPNGCETLITRIVSILTEKEYPSTQLVLNIRRIYETYNTDVRFILPVLISFKKQEIIDLLPSIIKLDLPIIKNVFKRILTSPKSPIQASDVLIALHTLDYKQCDIKLVIRAISLCLEKEYSTHETVIQVLNFLITKNPLPILIMRTAIVGLATFPTVIGFISTTFLQSLIKLKVWTQNNVWQGFKLCCQRMKSASCQILIKLPLEQLKDVCKSCPDLRDELVKHFKKLTVQQKKQMSTGIVNLLTDFGLNNN